jgi:hypothetical protein
MIGQRNVNTVQYSMTTVLQGLSDMIFVNAEYSLFGCYVMCSGRSLCTFERKETHCLHLRGQRASQAVFSGMVRDVGMHV